MDVTQGLATLETDADTFNKAKLTSLTFQL